MAQIFKDQRRGDIGPDVIQCEAFAGQLVRLEKSGRYFFLGGDQDGRISEIEGLGTVKRLAGGTVAISEVDLAAVRAAQAEFARLKAKAQPLTIVRGRNSLSLAAPVIKAVDDKRGFAVRAAYDMQNLYLDYTIDSPNPLLNTQPDPRILFKGGNCLDIQLAADPAADAKRSAPAPGDVRLLISRRADGTPIAVIYRPHIPGFTGTAEELTSPTGKESFDAIEAGAPVKLEYAATASGFTAVAVIPLTLLGWQPQPGSTMHMDVGYLFGNATGNQCGMRAYWSNLSPTAGIIGDIPSESRLEPAQWGTVNVE